MNIGVYITVQNEEFLFPHCYDAIHKVFPQALVLDFGSTDITMEYCPEPAKVMHGTMGPKAYIDLKNWYSKKHDRVFWVDGDEIYPEQSLRHIERLLHTDQDRVVTAWRCVKVDPNGQVYVEPPFVRGTSAWDPKRNRLAREWPNETLLHVDPTWNEPAAWQNTDAWCWHGVLLNRSSVKEGQGRYKKRLQRLDEAEARGQWTPVAGLPWGDENVKKYIPIVQDIKSKKRRG